jgi:lysophospholipid acyltransferase (LPLAT)-like uncharacterized protein
VPSVQTSRQAGPLPLWKTAIARAAGAPLLSYLDFVERRTRVATAPAAAEGLRRLGAAGRSCLVYAWHQDTYLVYLLARLVPEVRELVWLTHDRLRALVQSLPAATRGLPLFIFTLRDRRSRLEQIAQALERPTRLLVFPDSGGPYFQLKAGFIELARRHGMPIVPLAVTMERSFELGPMRHRIPLAGGMLAWSLGEPIFPDPTVDRAEGALAAAHEMLT